MTHASAVLDRARAAECHRGSRRAVLVRIDDARLSIVGHVAELGSLARTGIREITDDALVCRNLRVGELGQELQRESADFGG